MDQRTDRVLGDYAPRVRKTHRYLQALCACICVLLLGGMFMQSTVHAADGDVSTAISNPIADPIVHGEAVFFARKVSAWKQGDEQWLLLEGDAGFSIGVYGFRADNAVVRVVTDPQPGRTIRHLSVYLDNAKHLRGTGPVSAEAKRLLVTASTTGKLQVQNDLFVELDQQPRSELITDALARMQRYEQALARVTIEPPTEPLYDPQMFGPRYAAKYTPSEDRPVERKPVEVHPVDTVATGTAVANEASNLPQPVATRAPEPDKGTVLPTQGTVLLNADRVVYDPGEDESSIMLIGNVRVFYDDFKNDRQVSLRSERVVVFVDKKQDGAAIAPASVQADTVRGIYLEDNVIVADRDFTVRAPRVYYDVRENKAILLDAVIYSYDALRQLPLYMRAETIRQTSATSFNAQNVQLTTSEFAEPHFAIGAARLTLDKEDVESANDTYKFTASDTTLRVRDTPFFYWPYLEGKPTEVPIKRVKTGYDSDTGFELETVWDVFALAGREAPDGVRLLGKADWRGDHGPAVGADLEYGLENMFGHAETYLLLNDNGTDTVGGRRDIEQDSETRGYYLWQHRHYLPNGSELSLESAYVSDETFLEEFFRDEAYQSKPYETSLYWKKQSEDQALTFLTRYDLTDFTPQLAPLQTPGYTVDKAPEVSYFRTGTSLWDDKLTWFSENRAGFVRIRPGEDTPFDRGFSNRASMTLFGIPNTTAFDDAVFATGVPDEWVFRVDSRQEVNMPIEAGDFTIVPYAVGRVTAYDEDFSAYAGEADQYRLWGSLGTRVSTQLSRTFDTQNGMLDVDGIRHIVEPSVDVFVSGSSLDSEDIPVYDYDVESLQEGEGLRLGLTNTFQTHRGSGAQRRAVDWIVWRTDLVFNNSDADVDDEIARFFDYRPEYSTGGDHLYTELLWMVTDTFGITGELTHSMEHDRIVQWRVGGSLQHTPRFTSFVRYDEIDLLDSRLLSFGFTYVLTVKYQMGFRQRLDFERDESQSVDVWLERRVPKWRIRLTASVDEIDNAQAIGIVLIPEGFGGGINPLMQ